MAPVVDRFDCCAWCHLLRNHEGYISEHTLILSWPPTAVKPAAAVPSPAVTMPSARSPAGLGEPFPPAPRRAALSSAPVFSTARKPLVQLPPQRCTDDGSTLVL